MCTEDEVEIFIGTGALLDIFAYICIFVDNDPSFTAFTDEGGGAGLRRSQNSTGIN